MTTSLTSLPNSSAARSLGLPDIAFVGKAGAGKSTAAQELAQFGYTTMSVAQGVKDAAAMLWGEEARTDRSKLQKLGTDVARLIDPDVWVNLLLQRLRFEEKHRWMTSGPSLRRPPIAVDDCRFGNEWYALQGEGFVIVRILANRSERINRLKANGKFQDEEQLEHVSETAIDHLDAPYEVINDGSKSDLVDDLVDVLIKARRRS